MSIKDKFSEDEWFLLSATPASIGAIMSAASPSGVFGTIKELSAIMRATVEGLQVHSDSELITSLLERAENWSDAKARAADYRDKTQDRFKEEEVKSREKLVEMVLADCQTVSALVDERVAADEAETYKDWCLSIATKVAEASKEGSILGFGGTRVSEEEAALLTDIETALNVPHGKLLTYAKAM